MAKRYKTEYAITDGDTVEHFDKLEDARKRFDEMQTPYSCLFKKVHVGTLCGRIPDGHGNIVEDVDWTDWKETVLEERGEPE